MKYTALNDQTVNNTVSRSDSPTNAYILNHFPGLQTEIGGIENKLYLVGGPNKIGKSLFLMNLFTDLISSNVELKCLFFSFKDEIEIILNRLYSYCSGIDIRKIENPQPVEGDAELHTNCKDKLKEYFRTGRFNIFKVDSMMGIKKLVNQEGKSNPKVAVFIDDLPAPSSISSPPSSAGNIQIMASKILSEECNIPVIAAIEFNGLTISQDWPWDFFLLLSQENNEPLMNRNGEWLSTALTELEQTQLKNEEFHPVSLKLFNNPNYLGVDSTSYYFHFFINKLKAIEYIFNPHVTEETMIEEVHGGHDFLSYSELKELLADEMEPEINEEFLPPPSQNGDDDEAKHRFEKFLEQKLASKPNDDLLFNLENTGAFRDFFPGYPAASSSDEEEEVSTPTPVITGHTEMNANQVEFFEVTNYDLFSKHETIFKKELIRSLLKKRKVKVEPEIETTQESSETQPEPEEQNATETQISQDPQQSLESQAPSVQDPQLSPNPPGPADSLIPLI